MNQIRKVRTKNFYYIMSLIGRQTLYSKFNVVVVFKGKTVDENETDTKTK